MSAELFDFGLVAGGAVLAVVSACWAIKGILSFLIWLGLAACTLPPLFLTSDWHLALYLPHVDLWGGGEPFAEYFVLYLPITACVALTLAALVVGLARQRVASPKGKDNQITAERPC